MTTTTHNITTITLYLDRATTQGPIVDEVPNAQVIIPDITLNCLNTEVNKMIKQSATLIDPTDAGSYSMLVHVQYGNEFAQFYYDFYVQELVPNEHILMAHMVNADNIMCSNAYNVDLSPLPIIPLHAVPAMGETPVAQEDNHNTTTEEEVTMTNDNTVTFEALVSELTPEQISLFNTLAPEQQEAVKAIVAKQQNTKEETTMTTQNIEVKAWMKAAMDELTMPNENVFFSILMNIQAESTKEVAAEIEEMLVDMEENKAWETTLESQIAEYKGWKVTEVNKVAQVAFKAGVETQKGVTKATQWVGEQIEKAGKAVQKQSHNVGKTTAAPFMAVGKLASKKDYTTEAKKEDKKEIAVQATAAVVEAAQN